MRCRQKRQTKERNKRQRHCRPPAAPRWWCTRPRTSWPPPPRQPRGFCEPHLLQCRVTVMAMMTTVMASATIDASPITTGASLHACDAITAAAASSSPQRFLCAARNSRSDVTSALADMSTGGAWGLNCRQHEQRAVEWRAAHTDTDTHTRPLSASTSQR
jgi:hypothetical protein